MNKIALILATYKPDLKMLNQALECSNLFDEVILHVNDKETFDIVKCESKIKIIYREKRVTVQEAFNEAIYWCDKKFILNFTDDDFFHKPHLENLLNFIRTNKNCPNIIHYPIYAGNEKDGWHIWGDNSIITYDKLIKQNLIPFSCVYKKYVWQDVGGYKSGEFSDWRFWLDVLKNKYELYYTANPVYYHREGHKETLSNKESISFNKEEFIKRIINEQN